MAGKKENENKCSKSALKGTRAAIANKNENALSDYRGDC